MIELIESLTRERFSLDHDAPLFLKPILKGGSGRNFYRFHLSAEKSLIAMHYTEERPENALYFAIGKFLERLEVPVPHIEAHDHENRVLWMEDLGEIDLYSLKEKSWEERKEAYQKTLRAIKRLHEKGWVEALKQKLVLMPGFDAKLYKWERSYFLENLVERVCEISLSNAERDSFEREGEVLAKSLLNEVCCLVHRDFQSQNVILKNDKIFFIDFQGMRSGAFFYDLASLLYDPYISFSEKEQLELLRYYFELESVPNLSWALFYERFQTAAIQRLMQALGAYGFLGLVKGKKEFLHSILPALTQLKAVAQNHKTFNRLVGLLDNCMEKISNKESYNFSV